MLCNAVDGCGMYGPWIGLCGPVNLIPVVLSLPDQSYFCDYLQTTIISVVNLSRTPTHIFWLFQHKIVIKNLPALQKKLGTPALTE